MAQVCNIGPAERKVRRTSAILFAGLTLGVWLAMLLLRLPWWFGFLLVPTTFIAALNYLQDQLEFCAGYGLAGMVNLSGMLGNVEKVSAELASAHKKRTWEILSKATILTVAVILVLVGLLIVL